MVWAVAVSLNPKMLPEKSILKQLITISMPSCQGLMTQQQ